MSLSEKDPVSPSRPLGSLILWAVSVLVGIVAGLGAVVFRMLIAFFHNLLFLGRLSLAYDANTHTPASPWGFFIVLVPVIGAFGVAFLVKNFAPEAKGHGVPEVMDAVYHREGVIRPVVSIIKGFFLKFGAGSFKPPRAELVIEAARIPLFRTFASSQLSSG